MISVDRQVLRRKGCWCRPYRSHRYHYRRWTELILIERSYCEGRCEWRSFARGNWIFSELEEGRRRQWRRLPPLSERERGIGDNGVKQKTQNRHFKKKEWRDEFFFLTLLKLLNIELIVLKLKKFHGLGSLSIKTGSFDFLFFFFFFFINTVMWNAGYTIGLWQWLLK